MMLDRLEGNKALKEEVSRMLSGRRLSHSLLLIGEQGLGAGFAARCIAADYLYPAGGPAAEALLRGECCRPWPRPATGTAAGWRPAWSGRPSPWKGWAPAAGTWWAR